MEASQNVMSHGRYVTTGGLIACDIENIGCSSKGLEHELWPLDEIEPNKAKFPCCLVWTPLPVVSWLAPFIGHVGICREDGVIFDFSGSYLVNVDAFAFGAPARYLQLDRAKCCFPANLSSHVCKQGFRHSELGISLTWDDALRSTLRYFEHKTYNLFTCNSHSFAANFLNRVTYEESMEWNMVNVALLVLLRGQWVNLMSIVRSFLPFVSVLCLGVSVIGWPFVVGLLLLSMLLIGWFLLCNYCAKSLLDF